MILMMEGRGFGRGFHFLVAARKVRCLVTTNFGGVMHCPSGVDVLLFNYLRRSGVSAHSVPIAEDE